MHIKLQSIVLSAQWVNNISLYHTSYE